MSSSKKMTLKGTAAGVYLSEAQNPIPPPLSLTHCIRLFSMLGHTGTEGGDLNQREGERATVHKAGSKIPT